MSKCDAYMNATKSAEESAQRYREAQKKAADEADRFRTAWKTILAENDYEATGYVPPKDEGESEEKPEE